MSTKTQPGRFDAFAKLGPDEPFFILRAQDALAADLVELWAIRARAGGTHIDKTRDAVDLAEEMRQWPKRKHPD
jgi:hypothetical protein